MKTYFVYILECSDGSFYTGVTGNLVERLEQHEHGLIPSCYTSIRRPLKCVFHASFGDPNTAIMWEKRIKGWSRKKKQALIDGDFDELVRLSNLKNTLKINEQANTEKTENQT